jgi:nitroreductase
MSDPAEIFSKIPDLNHTEEMKEVSALVFDNIINNRRSVRVYTEEKVPEQVMTQVLDWALMAPNSSNLQCWEFYWVKNPSKKSALVKALFNQPAARTAQELVVAVARTDRWKMIRKQMLEAFKNESNIPASAKAYYEKLVPLAYNQGPLGLFGAAKKVFTSVVGLTRPIPREPNSCADMRVWAVKSTALACQNIMMGFSAHGFDTCPMEGLDSKRVKKILGLKGKSEIVMAISVGKRAKNGVYGPRVRMPKEQFIKII